MKWLFVMVVMVTVMPQQQLVIRRLRQALPGVMIMAEMMLVAMIVVVVLMTRSS